MECTSPIESLSCLITISGILFPLVIVSWLVGMMVAALFLRDRGLLVRVGAIALPIGFLSTLAIATLFALMELGGVWELLVGPAVVVGECAGFARIAALRAARTT